MSADTNMLIRIPATLKKNVQSIGFKFMLAWHFVVLFTTLLTGDEGILAADFIFIRQMTLYITLALTFFVLAFFGKPLLGIRKPIPSRLLHGIVGLASILATSAVISLSFIIGIPVPLQLLAVFILGCCEATMMYLWIHHLLKNRVVKPRRALAIDIIAGALIAFLTLSLDNPLALIIVAVLPGIAAFSLSQIWSTECKQKTEAISPLPKQAERALLTRFIKNHLPSAVFALTFGLMQGALIEMKITFFLAPVPMVLLGILVAGVIIFLIKERADSYGDIDTMHRYALLLLILGVLGLSFIKVLNLEYISEAALLAGFNLFDFGALALSMAMVRRPGLVKAHFIDFGRALVYSGFALGLVFGYFGCYYLSDASSETLLNAIGGIAVVLLAVTMLMKLDKRAPSEPVLADGSVSLEASPTVSEEGGGIEDSDDTAKKISWKEACMKVSKTYRLSPRETEVFLLLAKGRNAEYIQGKLIISLHTAKSHIANIYQKLGVHSIQEVLDLLDAFMMR